MDLLAFLDRVNHRTAVYVIRTRGGVGGKSRKAFPYPDSENPGHRISLSG